MSIEKEIAILRLKDVARKTSLSRSTIYGLAAAGDFPTPVKLGVKASGWLAHEIEDWLRQRVERSRGEQHDSSR